MTFKNLKRNKTLKKFIHNKNKSHGKSKNTIKNSKGGTSILDNSAKAYNTLMSAITGNDDVDYHFEPIPMPIDFIEQPCDFTTNNKKTNKTKYKFYDLN